MLDGFGVYLHVPFCLSKCPYCDFCSFPGSSEEDRERYVKAVLREIKERDFPRRSATSVFFGGGTPSLLDARQFDALLSAVSKRHPIAPDAEITFEMNPATADREKLNSLRSLGFNRVSIGCQSLSDEELSALGRAHTAEGFFRAYEDALAAGFTNINIDLMYGIPRQTEDSFAKTLETVASLSPTHVSAYGLIVEEGTPFYRRRDSLGLPGDDVEADLYAMASRTLRSAGYAHYEISNYARPGGYECRHNLLYWRQGEYAAYGLSASSHIGGVRETNTRDLLAYLSDPANAVAEKTVIEGGDAEYEYIMLALRLTEGIGETDFGLRFGRSF
ncbi:MAG: radical SAM family heme chaperone HemW, partial [Clostridia bacterium]|nr:radical SAM family heme chaperone HemW [Clostridia bacterium]